MLTLNMIYIFFLLSSDVSFKEPQDLSKLMKALDECILFNTNETKDKIRNSRIKSLLPEFKIVSKYEENDLESNKLAESSPYLFTNFKSGWTFEVGLKWTLDGLLFSKEEEEIKKDHLISIDKYLSLQNTLSETYYRIVEIVKTLENLENPKERESLEKEYNILNSRINILTCHKYKTINKKED